ncbi:MAG: ABC transporter permease [Saprospiraceae bacterium]|nr:MAG: ABC transporter permease [Saprospiraceae bacterium]
MKKTNNHPPKWADKFLEWYCKPELLEEIQGDIYELFYNRIEEGDSKEARRRFAWDVLRSLRLSTIKNFNLKLSPIMLRSNVKIAFRHLLKQKQYSFIKIGGFALGIAACLLISLFIRDELSYDLQYPDVDRIYRVIGQFNDDGKIEKGVHFPAPFGDVLESDYPEVELSGRFNSSELFGAGANELRVEGEMQNFHEDGFVFADQEFMELLDIPMVYGDVKHALAQPHSIVISKSKADKYFPNENPVGKHLILNNDEENAYKIGGVMEDFPATSHLHFDFLMTMTQVEFWPGEQTFWQANNYHTYIKVRPGVDAAQLEKKMLAIIDDYIIPSEIEAGSTNIEENARKASFYLQPLRDIHLRSEGIFDRLNHGDIRFVWLFGAIAIFILLIACINFINLSTAKSANRAKEVGLRKVLGSVRGHLVNQFLIESVLFSLFSFIIGVLLAGLVLPFFNQLADKSLSFPWHEWWFVPLLLVSTLVVGLFAGLYPSFYLSAFRPIDVLKGDLSRGSKSSGMRNALVVFQFTTSIILIIGTFIIYRQMDFILNKKLGYEKEQVLILGGANTLAEKESTFKQALLQLPQVKSASLSDFLPIPGTKRNGNVFWREGKTKEEDPISGQIWQVDHDYLKTMGMNIVEGRDFSVDLALDSQAVIINQDMAKRLALDEPIGKRITNSSNVWEIIGVVEDFHSESIRDDIRPLCMVIGNNTTSHIAVKVNTTDMPGLIKSVEGIWDRFSPNQNIRYTFLDESFATMYADVQRMGRIFTSFAILAIIVACLGLFGLSAFMAEQRSKEISIRKVLGASVKSIIRLLTQSFLTLVLISLLIAIPLAWYVMQKWLEDFAYHITISWDVFVLAGLIAIVIALATISFQAIRTATANPVEALRKE